MSTVPYADICDVPSCRTRSDEFSRHAVCRECLRDFCESHVVPGSYQGDTGRALCLECAATAALSLKWATDFLGVIHAQK